MFTNYETPLRRPCPPPPPIDPTGAKLLTNIKGRVLGVQVNYGEPLQLYFHLENIWEVNEEELLGGTVLFEILATSHKLKISHEYQLSEILDPDTQDLCVQLPSEEMKLLKKETYNMRVTIKTNAADYIVFAEKAGYLVIR
jgi:hypothetical protein